MVQQHRQPFGFELGEARSRAVGEVEHDLGLVRRDPRLDDVLHRRAAGPWAQDLLPALPPGPLAEVGQRRQVGMQLCQEPAAGPQFLPH